MSLRVHCLAILCVFVCLSMVDRGTARIIPANMTVNNIIDWTFDNVDTAIQATQQAAELSMATVQQMISDLIDFKSDAENYMETVSPKFTELMKNNFNPMIEKWRKIAEYMYSNMTLPCEKAGKS